MSADDQSLEQPFCTSSSSRPDAAVAAPAAAWMQLLANLSQLQD